MKKIFTLLAAFAVTMSVSAKVTEYAVSSPGDTAIDQILDGSNEYVVVTANHAGAAGRNVKTTGSFADGRPFNFFGTVSTGCRIKSTPTAEDLKGTPNSDTQTSFNVVVKSPINNFTVYFAGSHSDKGSRSFAIFNHSTLKETRVDGQETTEVVNTSGNNVGMNSNFGTLEAGNYTIYVRGFGGEFIGLTYEVVTDEATNCELAFEKSIVTAALGEEYTLAATVKEGALGTINYTSENTAVATVDANGTVNPVGEGTTTITATYVPAEGETYVEKSASYTLTVSISKDLVAFNVPGKADQGVTNFGTATSGSVTVNKVKTNAYQFGNAWNGTDATTSNGYLKLTCNGGFKIGDKLIIKGAISNGTDGKRGAVKIHVGDYNHVATKTPDFVDTKIETTAEATEFTYVIEHNADVIYLSRDGNTKTFVTMIDLVREDVTFEAPTLSDPWHSGGVNLDGTPNGHAYSAGEQVLLNHALGKDVILYTLDGQDPNEHNIYVAPAAAPARAAAVSDEDHTGKTYRLTERPIIYNGEALNIKYGAYKAGHNPSAVQSLEIAADNGTTGIESIGVDAQEGAVEYFNLQGVRVENPSNGIYIRRQGNTVTKVIVK